MQAMVIPFRKPPASGLQQLAIVEQLLHEAEQVIQRGEQSTSPSVASGLAVQESRLRAPRRLYTYD
jgi:hypothetical protein